MDTLFPCTTLFRAVCQVHIPRVSNWLANKLLNSDGMIAGENKKSAVNAYALMETVKARVPADQLGETFVINCPGTVTHWQLAVRASTHDLTVFPVYGHAEPISVAEGLVFESGRPVFLQIGRASCRESLCQYG